MNSNDWNFLYRKSTDGPYPLNTGALVGDCTMELSSLTKTMPDLGSKSHLNALSAQKYVKIESIC